MKFDIITIFPELFGGALDHGIIRRARQSGIVDVRLINLRDFAKDKHRSVDDRPYGGGEGMVLMPGPLFEAVEFCFGAVPEQELGKAGKEEIILLSPQGRVWTQPMARELSERSHVILICGRYEGVDQRVLDALVDREISIGDFVLSGGEIPAMVILDSVIRLLPGALGNVESAKNESFSAGLLDCPHYTRPAEFRGMTVPEVLLSGNHAEINRWRRSKAMEKTLAHRPELVEKNNK